MAAKAGHDLTLEVTSWSGEVTVDSDNPSASSVAIEAETGSIEVREGTGGMKPLADKDRADIKKSMTKVLGSQTITFKSTSISGTPGSFQISGDVTISGVTKPVTVQGSLADGRAKGSATVVQTEYGIQPFSGMFGALKLKDEVGVEFSIGLA